MSSPEYMSALQWVALAGLAIVLSAVVLWLIGTVPMRRRTVKTGGDGPAGGAVHLLFRGDGLVDHDAPALARLDAPGTDWKDIRTWLAPRFDGLPESPGAITEGGEHRFPAAAPDDGATLLLARSGPTTRIALHDPSCPDPAVRHENMRLRRSLEAVTDALANAPNPIWRMTGSGTLVWRNPALASVTEDPATDFGAVLHPDPPEPGETREIRICLPGDDPKGTTRSYDVTATADADGMTCHATDISAIVRAESAQRDFVQTLAKTFANLATGLAVFDNQRQLVLFNPALVDLTALRADFLSGRPHMLTFFDRLRDQQVMPEPRSYASWKTRIGEVIDRASDGLYEETWTLPSDLTYRVTGRPHPDGGIAFLFEDITAEVLVSRRFRSQLDLRQAALDRLPEAVIVIGPDNVVTFCNTACTTLLGIDPDSSFADMTARDLLAACRASLPDAAPWDAVEAALTQRTGGGRFHHPAAASGSHGPAVRVSHLPGGARMLTLHGRRESAEPAERTLTA